MAIHENFKNLKTGNTLERMYPGMIEYLKPGEDIKFNAPSPAGGYRDYLMTVSQMTDDVSQRRQREKILRAVIGSVFSSRDSQREFTPEQRRLRWNSSVTKSCSECGVKLTWGNFSVDHVDPHSRGGRSELDNAALVCQSCNSSKGNRRSARGNMQR